MTIWKLNSIEETLDAPCAAAISGHATGLPHDWSGGRPDGPRYLACRSKGAVRRGPSALIQDPAAAENANIIIKIN
jgi:hypothetical protein